MLRHVGDVENEVVLVHLVGRKNVPLGDDGGRNDVDGQNPGELALVVTS